MADTNCPSLKATNGERARNSPPRSRRSVSFEPPRPNNSSTRIRPVNQPVPSEEKARPLMCHLGSLLVGTGEDHNTSSSDESLFNFEANFLPHGSSRSAIRRPSSTVIRDRARTKPQPGRTQSSPANPLLPPLSVNPVRASILEVNDPPVEAAMTSPTQSDSYAMSTAGSTAEEQCTSAPDYFWQSRSSSNFSSPKIRTNNHQAPGSSIEMPLPCGFEHSSIKQIFESIDTLIANMKSPFANATGLPHNLLNGQSLSTPSSETATTIEPGDISIAQGIPSEIIVHIFKYLDAVSFNAARHSCRSWMNASLNKPFLQLMLQRGAWWSLFRRHWRRKVRPGKDFGETPHDRVWIMSCFLARECMLSGMWTGNGLSHLNYSAIATCDHDWFQCPKPSCSTSRRSLVRIGAFREVAHISFGDIACEYSLLHRNAGLIFSASPSGNYVLVAEGGMIYVYKLFGDDLRATASIMCPRRVLSMSVDVSRGRLAIAALLVGRLGLMCNLALDPRRPAIRAADGADAFSERHRHKTTFPVATGVGCLDLESGRNTEVFDIRSSTGAQLLLNETSEAVQQRPLVDQAWVQTHSHSIPGQRLQIGKSAQMSSLLVQQKSLYHQLCTDEDPPRSVAICPQRQCVAFGCSTGLELHWIDATTGRDMHRWFPMAGPSDHLHFLPSRRDIDSRRRLRLISSAAHPRERLSIALKFTATKVHTNPAMTNTFWGTIGFDNSDPRMVGIISDSDHYQALPYPDGCHVLFIDPELHMLCMGSDASAGDRSLVRKVLLVPPTKSDIPRLYAACFDLTMGHRIVVGYGDHIILYSVPPDVFELSTKEQRQDRLKLADLKKASAWREWLQPMEGKACQSDKLDAVTNSGGGKEDADSVDIWPLSIAGTPVGRLRRLCELTISTDHGRMSIWGFAADGEASVWQINNGRPQKSVTQRTVAKNGRVLDPYQVDETGDVVMEDTVMPSAPSDEPTSTPSIGHLRYATRAEETYNGDDFISSYCSESDDSVDLNLEGGTAPAGDANLGCPGLITQ